MMRFDANGKTKSTFKEIALRIGVNINTAYGIVNNWLKTGRLKRKKNCST